MMPCLVNQLGALVDEAFDVVDTLFVDPGVVPKFLLIMLLSYFSSLFSRG